MRVHRAAGAPDNGDLHEALLRSGNLARDRMDLAFLAEHVPTRCMHEALGIWGHQGLSLDWCVKHVVKADLYGVVDRAGLLDGVTRGWVHQASMEWS